MNPTRRAILAAGTLAAPMLLPRRAAAQARSIQVGIYASNQGQYVRTQIIPKFERDHACRVFPTEGVTLAQVALLRAQRSNPKYSVMFMDDVGVPIAKAEGLIDPLPLARMPNAARVLPRFITDDGFGIAFAISSGGLFYNPAATKPLASYAELWDSRFRQRFLMQTPKNTQSVYLLIATAAIVTGKPLHEAQYLVDQAWGKLAELKPNVASIYDTFSSVMQVAQGEADIGGVEYSKNIYPYIAKGAAMEMCFPAEGTFAGVNCMTLVKNGPEPELAAAFLDRMLEPAVQQGLAEATATAPTISGLEFKPETAKLIAYPEAKMDRMGLFTADWSFVNPRRSAWLEKTNQIFVGG